MSERIIVTVKEGKVRGIKKSSEYSGAEYYSFYGIPYGQPPINTLRFKVITEWLYPDVCEIKSVLTIT